MQLAYGTRRVALSTYLRTWMTTTNLSEMWHGRNPLYLHIARLVCLKLYKGHIPNLPHRITAQPRKQVACNGAVSQDTHWDTFTTHLFDASTKFLSRLMQIYASLTPTSIWWSSICESMASRTHQFAKSLRWPIKGHPAFLMMTHVRNYAFKHQPVTWFLGHSRLSVNSYSRHTVFHHSLGHHQSLGQWPPWAQISIVLPKNLYTYLII